MSSHPHAACTKDRRSRRQPPRSALDRPPGPQRAAVHCRAVDRRPRRAAGSRPHPPRPARYHRRVHRRAQQDGAISTEGKTRRPKIVRLRSSRRIWPIWRPTAQPVTIPALEGGFDAWGLWRVLCIETAAPKAPGALGPLPGDTSLPAAALPHRVHAPDGTHRDGDTPWPRTIVPHWPHADGRVGFGGTRSSS